MCIRDRCLFCARTIESYELKLDFLRTHNRLTDKMRTEKHGDITISLSKKYARGETEILKMSHVVIDKDIPCLLYTSPSPRDATLPRMPSSA
eukprot:TRINITY_DN20307_c0_g1_i1.p1 TRINITY_DN20307_c0_g1~~TRINITY_DN20307_c0_g1_i1.p1  ORF type:complete len:105 (-),score=18.55 TRINITY_DN20307_c0_g1_i1:7-282(-)